MLDGDTFTTLYQNETYVSSDEEAPITPDPSGRRIVDGQDLTEASPAGFRLIWLRWGCPHILPQGENG